jgi:hypothetical protein
MDFTVIKTTLKSFVSKKVHAILHAPLEYLLFQVNKAVLEAYNLANIHTLNMLNKGLSINPDQSFYYKCLSAVGNSGNAFKDKEFQHSVDMYKSLRPVDYEVADSSYISSGIYQNFSLQMATNASNFIEMRFFTFFKRYLKHKHKLEGKVSYAYIVAIQSDEYKGTNELVLHYRNKVSEIVSKLKKELNYKEPDSFSKLFKYPVVVLPILHEILKYNESIHKKCVLEKKETDKGVRLFTLLPTKKGFMTSHIKICKSGLYGFLKHIENFHKEELNKLLNEIGINLKDIQATTIKGHEDDIWNLLFDIKKFTRKKKGSEFGNEILTDGKSVSITLKKFNPVHKEKNKKKLKKDKKTKNTEKIHNINLKDYETVWGLDPGRTSTFVATNNKGETISRSTRSYYEDAKFIESGRKMRGWTDRNEKVNGIIKLIPSSKSSELNNLIIYNKYILQNVDTLLNF